MIDHVALLPAYCAAGTVVLVFLAEMVLPGRRVPVLTLGILGALATGVASWWVHHVEPLRQTFCAPLCSYSWDNIAVVIGVVVSAATAAVLGLSVPVLRAREVPSGEYVFLLACSMTGGVVLGAARDLITLVIALETLTLPLYVLVGLRRRSLASAEAAVTFFVVSVVSTSVTLLGAALLYAGTGTVHVQLLSERLGAISTQPLMAAAIVLVLVGLAFKMAAVPFHAWAPATYDGAPLPVAAYLSTVSKLGGLVSLLIVVVVGMRSALDVAGPALAVIAVLTMTIGNLGALRQRRMVRLLAWSSVAQAGYILAPLGGFAVASGRTNDVSVMLAYASLAYAVFYIALELTAFGSVVALRGPADGGSLADYRGAATGRPWVAACFVLAMAGLAGLPPGLAGLFAKVTIVRALLGGGAGWLAVIVAINAVVGLAYYVRAAVSFFGGAGQGAWPRLPVLAGAVLAAVAVVAVVIGFAPQVVLAPLTP